MPNSNDEQLASDAAAREAIASHTVGIIVTDDTGNERAALGTARQSNGATVT